MSRPVYATPSPCAVRTERTEFIDQQKQLMNDSRVLNRGTLSAAKSNQVGALDLMVDTGTRIDLKE